MSGINPLRTLPIQIYIYIYIVMFDVDNFCPSSFCTVFLLMTHDTSGVYKNGIEKKVLLLHISRRIWEMDTLFGVWSRDGGGGLGDVVFPNPIFIGSMHCIFTYIWLTLMVNIGKYNIHGSMGKYKWTDHMPYTVDGILHHLTCMKPWQVFRIFTISTG